MSEFLFDPPVQSGGTNAEQLQELHRYLQRMTEQLNDAMNTLTSQKSVVTSDQKAIRLTRGAAVTTQQQAEGAGMSGKEYNALKSLIIKNATYISAEMDKITREMRSTYVTESDFGSFTETLSRVIEETASGVVQTFNYDGKIAGVQGNLDVYQKSISQYIYQGYVQEEGGLPKVGIAIGYNVTNEDGSLNHQNKYMTLTSDRLSFYVNGVEVAYYSNNVFYITKGHVTQSMQIGDRHMWRVIEGGNLVLNPVDVFEDEDEEEEEE